LVIARSFKGVDFDACILVGTHRLFVYPAFASPEEMQIEPQTKQVKPGLGCFAALKTAFDGQISLPDKCHCEPVCGEAISQRSVSLAPPTRAGVPV
jgi:hypothetical protein